ncbi:MAG: ABC transporter ATP-binding protein [Actinobacteria bacterium]|nr:ABC transporter ATP-binding protein [Actinomycetota bacterium]
MTETIEPTEDPAVSATLPDDPPDQALPDDAVPTPRRTVLRLVDVAQSVPDGRYRRSVLDGVDLDVAEGELVVLMGPSGSGKTTLLRIAAGLDRPERGMPVINGEHLWVLSASELAELRRGSVGYVEQRWNLLDSLTVAENVSLPLELDGVRRREAMREAMAALEDVGIAELARQFPSALSGGEQQRAAIARSLVGPRHLLVADEPTGALDALTAESVMRLLRRRCDAAGTAVLLATHDPAVAGWGDRVVYLRDGVLADRSAQAAR